MKYQAIREQIILLTNSQRDLKPQRKTVNFKGDRTVEPETAAYKVASNKYELRHLYTAYALLKGIPVPIIKNDQKIMNKKLLDILVLKYKPEEPVTEQIA